MLKAILHRTISVILFLSLMQTLLPAQVISPSDGPPPIAQLQIPPPSANLLRSGGIWNPAVQHPAQKLFLLGDAVMLRQAAALQLRSKSKPSASSNVDALLEQVRQDPVARWRFVPFLLRVTFEALSAPNPNAGQKAFRKTFENYMSYVQYQTAVYTRDRWLQYSRQPLGPPKPYQTGAANLLPQYVNVSGFNRGSGTLGIGVPGKDAISLVLSPSVVRNFPDYDDKAFTDLGADIDATAAAAGLGTSAASTAATLGIISAAVLTIKVSVPAGAAAIAAGGAVTKIVWLTPALLASGGFTGGVSFGFMAAMGIGIALVFAAVLGMVFADVIKADLYDKELNAAVAAGRQQVDVYSLLNPRYEYQAGLWNRVCRPGYKGIATVCYENCKSGFRDDGLYCGKPEGYSRGAGYVAWEKAKCEKENPQGCVQGGAVWYPKCKPGFRAIGLSCSPVCPQGFSDIGVSCKKPSYDRGVGSVPNPTESVRKANRVVLFSYLMKMLIGDPADSKVLTLAYPNAVPKSKNIASSTAGLSWKQIGGSLKHVSVGSDGTTWGVNAQDMIYRMTGSRWTNVSGSLKQISVGGASHVWGVNAQDQIYRWTGSTWVNVRGSLKHVSVGSDGTAWGVNAQDRIYRWTGSTWTNVPGNLKQISVGSASHVWGVNAQDRIYRWTGSSWINVPGSLKHVSVGSDGTAWGVNSANKIYRWTGSTWTNVPGGLKQISAGASNQVWGVNSADQIYIRNF